MKAIRLALAFLPVLLVAGAVPAFSSTAGPSGGSRLLDISALPKDPAAYERQKAIANARYAKWAKLHGVTAPRYTAVSGSLNQPGLDASAPSNTGTPPDATGSAGPSNYVEMVNSEIGVYSTTDLATAPTTLAQSTFVGDPTAATCDGQIQWDEQGQRWLYSALNCNATLGSENLYFGFSKGASPLPLDSSNWCRYTIPTGSNLEDYDKLGHDNTQIIIGANEYTDDGIGGFAGGKIFVLPKPAPGTVATCPTQQVEVGNSPVTLTVPDAFTPVPANIADSSTDGYVVANDNNSFSQLDLYTITPSVTSGAMSPTTAVAVPAYSFPASVPQPGTSDTLDSLDGRLTQAVAVTDPNTGQEGIWTQHTVDGGGPSVVRWYELTPGDTTPTQVGTVAGPNGTFAFMGAISPNADGENAAIFYNSGSRTQLAQLRVEDRHALTTPGTMVEDLLLGTSSSADIDFSCNYYFRGDPCRWGDYNGASPDPSNANLVWGTGELTTIAPDAPDSFSDPQWGSENAAIDVTPAANYTLNVATAGAGTGSVTSGDSVVNCLGTCSHSYAYGTAVALTATPGANSVFAGWSGDCTGTGTCDLPMGGPQNVTATFTPEQEQLNVSVLGGRPIVAGTVTSIPARVNCTSSCEDFFDYGTDVHLTATPAPGWSFAGWSGACSGIGTCTVSMDFPQAVQAFFTRTIPTLSVSLAGTGTGTVTSSDQKLDCSPNCSASYSYGATVHLTATAGANSVFTGWSGGCSGTGTCTLTMSQSQSVSANFSLPPEPLSVIKTGTGSGTVTSDVTGIDCGSTCSYSFAYWTVVTLTASPSARSTFNGWSVQCNSGSSADLTCTLLMTSPQSVQAKFIAIVCDVPYLRRLGLSAAKVVLRQQHCSVGTIKRKTSKTVKTGKVISQSPAGGKHLPYGSPVKLVVSKGK